MNIDRTTQLIKVRPNKASVKIIFGSCFQMEDFKSEIFGAIAKEDPDVFSWLGDAAYVDDMKYVFLQPHVFADNFHSFEKVRERFWMTESDPFYRRFVQESLVQVVGVWDDHDYGTNNGDRTFKHKHEMRELFLDFIKEPQNTLRRREKQRGIYQDYLVVNEDGLEVLLVLLDIRFHYDKAGDKDRLGPEQWKWLRETFRAHKHVDLTLIASGVQVLPFREYQEVEESFTPFVRDRLLQLLEEEERSSVVLLSGDVHYTQFFNTPCRARLGYDLLELCSSGLSHILGKVVPYADLILSEMTPRIYTSTPVEGMKLNFGSIEVKREDGDVAIKLQS